MKETVNARAAKIARTEMTPAQFAEMRRHVSKWFQYQSAAYAQLHREGMELGK